MKSLKFIPEKLKVRNDKLQNNVHHNGYTFNKKYESKCDTLYWCKSNRYSIAICTEKLKIIMKASQKRQVCMLIHKKNILYKLTNLKFALKRNVINS